MSNNIEQLKKLAQIFNVDKIMSPQDVQEVFKGVVQIIVNYKKDNELLNKETKDTVKSLLSQIVDIHKEQIKEIKENTDTFASDNKQTIDKANKEFKKSIKEAQALIKEIQSIEVRDGKDADEEFIISQVLERIKLPEYKEVVLDDGEKIVEKINELPTETDEYKIDAKHIKNLPESKGRGGSTARNFYQLFDTPENYAGQAGKVVKVKTTEDGLEFGTGGTGGSSISINGAEVTDPDFLDTDEIDISASGSNVSMALKAGSVDETKLDASVNASLDLADSAVQDLSDLGITASATELNVLDGIPATLTATELGYVDGVTSSIQTQLGAKANDSAVVHNTGNENVGGVKTFTSDPIIPDEAYGSGWNGSLEPPTKNAIYDKLEELKFYVVASNVTTTADTATDVTGLSHSVDANSTYYFQIFARVGCSGAGAVKPAYSQPSDAVMLYTHVGRNTGSTAGQFLGNIYTGDSGIINNTFGGSNDFGSMIVGGTIKTTTAGTWKVQFASGASGQTSTYYAGSVLMIRKIA